METGNPISRIDSFAKYEACGNDYIVLDPKRLSFPLDGNAVRLLCSRHSGIGGDGVLAVRRATSADHALTIYNADGGEAEFSGNGVRIFARFLRDRFGEARTSFTVETLSGVAGLTVRAAAGGEMRVSAELKGPFAVDAEAARRVLDWPGRGPVTGYAVSTGNPHFVVPEDAPLDLAALGLFVQTHGLFPGGVNLELVGGCEPGSLRLRVFERGVGETLSSGSCALAAALVSRALGKTGPAVTVRMAGGELDVEIRRDLSLRFEGPIREIASGRLGTDLLSCLGGGA